MRRLAAALPLATPPRPVRWRSRGYRGPSLNMLTAQLERYRTDGLVVPRYRVPAALLSSMRGALDRLIRENPRTRPEHLVLRWGGGPGALPTHVGSSNARDSPPCWIWSNRCWARTSSSGAATSSASRPAMGSRSPGTRTGSTGRSGRSPPARCGSRWTTRRRRTAACATSPARTGRGASTSTGSTSVPDLVLNQVIRRPVRRSGGPRRGAGGRAVLRPRRVPDPRLERESSSPRRRAGFVIRYMPATSLYDRSVTFLGGAAAIRQNMALRPIYLVRGTDRHGGNDFTTGHDRPYEVGVPDRPRDAHGGG